MPALDWKGMAALKSVRAVSFDAMYTLVRPARPIGHTYAAMGSKVGLEVDGEAMERVFREQYSGLRKLHPAFAFHTPHLKLPDGSELTGAHPAKKFWLNIIIRSFSQLAPDATMKCLLPMAEEIYDHYSTGDPWELLPGTEDLLRFLQQRGLSVLVISNWDYRLKAVLEAKGIGHYISSVTVAGDVGVEKPNEELFRIALTATQALQASEVLHIGDDIENDYLAALRAGLQSRLLLSRPDSADPAALARIPPHHILNSLDQVRDHV